MIGAYPVISQIFMLPAIEAMEEELWLLATEMAVRGFGDVMLF